MKQTGLIIVNLGTPEEATARGVRQYLCEFLSDRRVIEAPRWFWWPLLNGIILPIRSSKVAKLYQSIWTDEGSPIKAITARQRDKLQHRLSSKGLPHCSVRYAMTYGQPSLEREIAALKAEGVERLVILPLYPQYSATTTGAVYDALGRIFTQTRDIPEHIFIHGYHDNPHYISALSTSVRQFWEDKGQSEALLISFHGIPQKYVDKGDPYVKECETTARLLVASLGDIKIKVGHAYQSRFGPATWTQPYTSDVLKEWAAKGIKSVDVICPGFASDCLETLEEVTVGYKNEFIDLGGEALRYIPALNASDAHIEMMCALTHSYLA